VSIPKLAIDAPLNLLRATLCASPAWLPDVFAALYDVLDRDGHGVALARTAARDTTARFIRENVRALGTLQRAMVGSLTDELRNALDEAVTALAGNSSDAAALTTCLCGAWTIDQVLAGLDPREADDFEPYSADYRAWLANRGTLLRSSALGGVLLPRAARPVGASRELADVFDNLVRLRRDDTFQLDYAAIDRHVLRAGEKKLRVAFVPTVQDPALLDWQCSDTHYTVRLTPAGEIVAWAAVESALAWAAACEAHLVVLPELVSSAALIRRISHWRAACPGRFPCMILAGSYLHEVASGPPRNRAVMLDASGTPLWYQDKLHPYEFTVAHQQAGGRVLSNPPCSLLEDIGTAPRRFAVRDIPGHHRYGIAICEDFARREPLQRVVPVLSVTHLFVPVMNPARVDETDWLRRYGIALAQDCGLVSLVANSGALVGDPGVDPRYHYAEAIGPDRDAIRWAATKHDESTGCVQALLLELEPDPHFQP
jgi:predicted amidohydrolase